MRRPAPLSDAPAVLAAGGLARARRGQVAYGIPIGVLMLDCTIPFVPGDVGNASTYRYPVLYEPVEGATGEAVIGRQDPALTDRFVAAARRLAAQGVRAITGDCSYMGVYQQAVADALPVPVFLSALLQAPLALRMLGGGRRLAVLVANGATVSERLLRSVGIGEAEATRCVFRGLEDRPCFRAAILEERGELDVARLEAELVATALELTDEDPSIGAFLLECSDMPPYGAAIQRATGLPVFDWIGFVDHVHHAVARRPYDGIV